MNKKLTPFAAVMLGVIVFAGQFLAGALLQAQDFSAASTDRVSQGTFSGATEPAAASINSRMSKNGRFIVFESTAGNLNRAGLPFNPTPGRRHVYLYDRQADSLELVSMTYQDLEPDADSFGAAVSNDGRYVAFVTNATLERNNNNSMVRVCCPGPDTVVVESCHVHKAWPGYHVYVRDRLANDTFLISQSTLPVRMQQYVDGVAQVVATPTTVPNGPLNVYPIMETVERRVAASVLAAHGQPRATPNSRNPRLSGDGRFVIYDTSADNLLLAGEEAVYSDPIPGIDFSLNNGILDGDVCLIEPAAFWVDGNDVRDIAVRDGQEFKNQIVSMACEFHDPPNFPGCTFRGVGFDQDGNDGGISDDGEYIVFSSKTAFLDLDFNETDDVYLLKRENMTAEVSNLVRISNNTTRLLAANGASTKPAISADGRYVAFQSAASDLVSGDTNGKTDIFLFDRPFNKLIRCSSAADGSGGNGDSTTPDISGSGEYISFQSTSTNFGASTSAGVNNIYLARVIKADEGDATGCEVELGSVGSGTGASSDATISGVASVPKTESDGTRVRQPAISYQTSASNVSTLVTDTNGLTDIFQSPICSETDRTTDTDSDGTTDCFDQCWKDFTKVEDVDTDFDGFADCEDACAEDPQKSVPGLCGCGVPDIDTDQDGTADCEDSCPSDPAKTEEGECGCGQVDEDLDNNGIADCNQAGGQITPAPSPSPTAIFTPTPVCPFPSQTPAKATLKKRAGAVNIIIPRYIPPTGSIVTGFSVSICDPENQDECVIEDRFIGSSRKRTLRVRAGRYVGFYKVIGDCGNSQRSTVSNTVRVVAKGAARKRS